MESTPEEQLEDIKKRKHQAQIDQAAAQARAESAREAVCQATEMLLEMGCASLDEARAKISDLQGRIDKALDEIRRML